MKYILNTMKFGTQTLKQVSVPSFQKNLVPKMKYIPNTMKFGTQSRSGFLIMNMIFEIADLDPKLKTWADLVSELQCTPTFVKFGT